MPNRALLAACALLAAGAVWSESTTVAAAAGPDRQPWPERVELLRMWRMVEALEVGEEQASRLFPLWSQRNRERRQLQERRHQVLQELAAALAQGAAGQSAVAGLIDRVHLLDQERDEESRRFQAEQAKLLTVRQQAQLLLFDERFRDDLRGMLKGLRGAAPGHVAPRSFAPPPWWDRLEQRGGAK